MRQQYNDEEVAESPAKLALKPPLGIARHEGALPYLQVSTKSKGQQQLSAVQARLLSLVIRPDDHSILYLECVCTSTSVAHSVMAAATEPNRTVQSWAYCPTLRQGYPIYPAADMRIADTKLGLRGHSGLHHFALISQDDTFILASDEQQLWAKLRKKMGCPSRDEWREGIMPEVMRSGCLISCEAFGLPPGMSCYVLDTDAEATFDRILGAWVKENGL